MGRRARCERGAATAELALGIPLLVALTAGLVWMLALGAAQVRVIDASREAARAWRGATTSPRRGRWRSASHPAGLA